MERLLSGSVLIATWNRSARLATTLESLARADVSGFSRFEVIVVDNASTDDTAAVLERWRAQLPLRCLYQPIPGKAACLNLALQQANTDVLLFTDDDVVVDPSWPVALARGLETMAADLVFGRVEPLWESVAPDWFGPSTRHLLAIFDAGPSRLLLGEQEVVGLGVNFAMKATVPARVGLFSESLGPRLGAGGGEDDDYFFRARQHGLRLGYEPAAVVYHAVPLVRCGRSYHRRRAWLDSWAHLQLLRAHSQAEKWWLGLPRYKWREGLEHAWYWLYAAMRGQKDQAFARELKFRRFLGLILAAATSRGREPCPENRS